MIFSRRQRKSFARTSACAFAFVWLSMAAQPCVMAFEALSEGTHGLDCPHCPETDHPCDHGAEAGKERCGYVDSYDYDGRTPDSPKAVMPDQVLSLLSLDSRIGHVNRQHIKIPRSLDAESPPGRYSLYFCVFLK